MFHAQLGSDRVFEGGSTIISLILSPLTWEGPIHHQLVYSCVQSVVTTSLLFPYFPIYS